MTGKEGKAKFTFKGKSYAAVTMDEVKAKNKVRSRRQLLPHLE